MDPITVVIMAVIFGACAVGLIVRIILVKGIDKAVDNYGRRRHVNNPPREIYLSDEQINHTKEKENGDNQRHR